MEYHMPEIGDISIQVNHRIKYKIKTKIWKIPGSYWKKKNIVGGVLNIFVKKVKNSTWDFRWIRNDRHN